MRRHLYFLAFFHPLTSNSNAPSRGSQKSTLHLKSLFGRRRYTHDRIRVAYVSADFREHPVSHLMAGVFECHDKSRFDVTAISLGPDDNSEMRQRLKASFERFIDARTYDDDQIANLIKSSEVDILVDLMGFTENARTRHFRSACCADSGKLSRLFRDDGRRIY